MQQAQPSVSVIIPCYNEADYIQKTLSALLDMDGDFEIVVVDGGSTDGTEAKSFAVDQVTFIRHSTAQRAAQMNRGAEESHGDILLFLHADTIPPEDFCEQMTAVMAREKVVGGAFYLSFDHDHWMLRFITWLTKFNFSWMTFGDHGIFVSRSRFKALGGYPRIPLFEDIEFQKMMRRHGKMVRLDRPVLTSARRFVNNGVLWQSFKDGLLLLGYHLGISARVLSRYYPK